MAKENRKLTITKATIDYEDGTITEYLKDKTKVHNIDTVLKKWDGIDGITISFSTDTEVVLYDEDDEQID